MPVTKKVRPNFSVLHGKTARLIFCALAGIVLSTGDMGHVYSGMAEYPHWQGSRFFNIPWWVPFEFAAAALLLIQTYPFKKRLFKLSDTPSDGWSPLLVSFLWTWAIYLGTSLIPESHPLIKFTLLLVALAAQIALNRMFYVGSLLEILSLAVGGCAVEFCLGKLGIFIYFPSPSIVGIIPQWLAIIYASAAVTVRIFCTNGRVG